MLHACISCSLHHVYSYRIGGNFRWCKFSYELFIRTAQHSDVEPIVQGTFRSFNFRMMLSTIQTVENVHRTKITRYTVCVHTQSALSYSLRLR